MKNKYGIGFLLFLILVVFGITCAYQLSLNKGKREIQAKIKAEEQAEKGDFSVAADGQALKEDCYYLKALNGYVVVYLNDKKTVYEYTDIPARVFSEGLTYLESGEYIVKIAFKEKALCDSLCKWRVVKSIKELKKLLFIDKRIDEDEFATCDFKLMKRLASLYNKTNLKLLLKLIKKEYEHE